MTTTKRHNEELQESLTAMSEALLSLSAALSNGAANGHLPKRIKAFHTSMTQKRTESKASTNDIAQNKEQQEASDEEEEESIVKSEYMSSEDEGEDESIAKAEYMSSEDEGSSSDNEHSIKAEPATEEHDEVTADTDTDGTDEDELHSDSSSDSSSSNDSSSSDDDSSDEDELDSE
ncbi:hypothetical protein K501DRAFT_334370 [Backusella circina FSU 941]|nr:hypothetical protein K501DRAFT_334370 [Backusella circina FSU 941]